MNTPHPASSEPNRPFVERRQRKPDIWSRVLTYSVYILYPLLAINLFTFLAVATDDQRANAAREMGETSIQRISSWVHFYAFLPIMIAGIFLAVGGLILDKRRARRRTDNSRRNQIWLLVVSIVGVVFYFLIR